MNKNLNNSKEKQLNKKQLKAINLLVYSSLSQLQIAAQVKVTETTLSTWLNHNDLFIAEYDKELTKAQTYRQRKYKSVAQQAVSTIVKLMLSSDNDKVKLDCAKEILDRAGDKVTDKLDINANVNNNPLQGLTTEELRKLVDLDDTG